MLSEVDSSPATQEKLKVAFAEGYLASDKKKADPEASWSALPRRIIRYGMIILTVWLVFQLLQTYSALGGSMFWLLLVLSEYSKFWIESNSYFSILFDSKRAQLFEIHNRVQENDVSVNMCMCTVLLLTMVQVLYLLEVFILAHYGPPSTETLTTETTTVLCHKNSWIYLTSTYYWWLLRPTITIRFEVKRHCSHSTIYLLC